MITDPADPQCYSWHGLFQRYTWWRSCDGNDRVFVIIELYHDNEANLVAVEILEKDTEVSKRVEYPDFFKSFKNGLLQHTSTSPY